VLAYLVMMTGVCSGRSRSIVSPGEIEAYLAVMRLINVALAVLTEHAQGTRVPT